MDRQGKVDTRAVNKDTDSDESQLPDGGWGWVVVFGALMINIIYDGCSYSFGILFANFLDYFNDTKSNTAWIGSLFFSVPLLCGPFVEKIVARIGHRKGTIIGGIIAALGFALSYFATSTLVLCLTYGLLSGVGMSFPYFTSGVIVAEYFNKRRGLAVGIVECGAGAGTIVFAPLTEYLISKFGWRGALLILSGIVLNITVCGTLFKPIKSYKKIKEDRSQAEQLDKLLDQSTGSIRLESMDQPVRPNLGSKNTGASIQSLKSIYCAPIRNRQFLVFSISNFVMYFWYDVPYVFVVDKSLTLGISVANATLLVTCIGILHTIGNILYGILSDRKCVNRTLLYGTSIILCGLSILFTGFLKHVVTLGFSVGAFGFFSSASEAMCSLILVDIMGLENLEEGYGIIMLLQGVANLIGPPVAGLLCDVTGNFDATFYTAGACIIVAGCLYILLPCYKKMDSTRDEPDPVTDTCTTNGLLTV